MNINFDKLGNVRNADLLLYNPNDEILWVLDKAKDVEYTFEFNSVSELSFTIPKYHDADLIEYYDDLIAGRIVKIEDVGAFLIQKVEREIDGNVEYKNIECVGLEFELSDKCIVEVKDVYKLYDGMGGNTDLSLMEMLITYYIPNWKVTYVDSDLYSQYRYFEVNDTNVFNFLMEDVAKTFDCVFKFDTFNRGISIHKTANVHKPVDIFIDKQNLLKSLNIEENADDLITALNVFGGGELSIRGVNPMGTPTLYDFSYYMKNGLMSEELVDAITIWNEKCVGYEDSFADLLSSLDELRNDGVILQVAYTTLMTEKAELEQRHAIAIVAEDNVACASYKKQIDQKQTAIDAKKVEVDNNAASIENVVTSLSQISEEVSLENPNNFTKEQRKELDIYIKQGSVTNSNFIILDTTTIQEQQDIEKGLMSWGKEQLERCSQPIWEFDMDCVNFIDLIEFKNETEQLELGSEIVIGVDKIKDLYAYATLIGYTRNLETKALSLKFSNQLNYASKALTYDELFDSACKVNKSYEFDTSKRYKSEKTTTQMDKYIEQGFVDITKEVLATTNQEFEISDTGIRGREWLPESNSYSNKEVRMTKNVLAFSDDNFATTKTAIGEITMPDGTKSYGVIAESLVGKQILGSTLFLGSEDGSLSYDERGLIIKSNNIFMGNTDETITQAINTVSNTANTANTTANAANGIANACKAKVDGITDENNNVLTSKLVGDISAGQTNIVLGNGSNFMRLNENGILITRNGGASYQTAIGTDGIYAEQIKAGGTISGCNAIFGQLNEGNNRCIQITDLGFFTGSYGGRKCLAMGMQSDGSYLTLGDPSINGGSTDVFDILVTDGKVNIDSKRNLFIDASSLIKFDSPTVGIENDFYVAGEKDAIIPTQHYGVRTLYCQEGDKAYFTTKGVVEVEEEMTIELDTIFTETIELNSSYPYIINATPYSNARVWIEQIEDYSFKIKTDKPTKVAYELCAVRISFGDKYLEEKTDLFDKQSLKRIQEKVIRRMSRK